MRSRITAFFAAALLAVGIGLAVSTPASAAAGGDCADNSFCLYQWVDKGAQVAGNRWQTSLYNIDLHTANCLNIAPATWANGTPVADNSSSLQWRASSELYRAGTQIVVFQWANCNPGGGSYHWSPTSSFQGFTANLSTLPWLGAGGTLYHSISSVAIYYS